MTTCDRVAYQNLLKENNTLKKNVIEQEGVIEELLDKNLELSDKLAKAEGRTYPQQVGFE